MWPNQQMKMVTLNEEIINGKIHFLCSETSQMFLCWWNSWKIDDSKYRVCYMSPKVVLTADYNEHKRRYWYCLSKKDNFDTNMSCILNVRPVISIATPPSTKRLYIFACCNVKLLEIIANSVSDVIWLFL